MANETVSTMADVFNNYSIISDEEDKTEAMEIRNWKIGLTTVQCVAVITNMVLIVLICFDMAKDARRRYWAKHILLLSSCFSYLLMALFAIINDKFLRDTDFYSDLQICRFILPFARALEIVSVLTLVAIAFHTLLHMFSTGSVIGCRQFVFWLMMVLLGWSVGFGLAYGPMLPFIKSRTYYEYGSSESRSACVLDREYHLYRLELSQIALGFWLPHLFILVLSFFALIGLCVDPAYAVSNKETPEMFEAKQDVKHLRTTAALFLFLTGIVSAGARFPSYLLAISAIDYELTHKENFLGELFSSESIDLRFGLFLMHSLYIALFPLLCFILKDIHTIFYLLESPFNILKRMFGKDFERM